MGKAYWAFIGVAIALFIYAGTTGNFGIIPRLPFDLPFGRHVQPTDAFIDAAIVGPQLSGPTGVTARKLIAGMKRVGTTYSWERARDSQSWILRFTATDELTGEKLDYVMRMARVADPAGAGVSSGPAVVVTEFVENGEYYSDPAILFTLNQLGASL